MVSETAPSEKTSWTGTGGIRSTLLGARRLITTFANLAQIGVGCSELNPGKLDGVIMREVEDVMDELCAKPSMVQFCDRCGSEMLYIDAAFFLINGTRGWSMRLPLCPQCHEGGDDLRAVSLKAA